MLRRFQTTSEGWLPTSHPCFVDPHSAAVPGMPTVTDLPRLGAMGIVSMSCITGLARTSHWRRMRRIHAVYSSPMLAASSPSPKWAGCITGTNAGRRPEFDNSTERTGHSLKAYADPRARTFSGCDQVAGPRPADYPLRALVRPGRYRTDRNHRCYGHEPPPIISERDKRHHNSAHLWTSVRRSDRPRARYTRIIVLVLPSSKSRTRAERLGHQSPIFHG